MPNTDISLHGVKTYAETKNGIPSEREYKDLKDLETLIKKMDSIRNGSSTENCNCHGNEVPSKYGENKTICSGHSFSYDPTNLSVKHFNDVIDGLKACSCDSFAKYYCDCHTNAVWCSCNSHS